MPASEQQLYKQHVLIVEAVLSDNGTEYKGRPMIHLYDIFFELNDRTSNDKSR